MINGVLLYISAVLQYEKGFKTIALLSSTYTMTYYHQILY